MHCTSLSSGNQVDGSPLAINTSLSSGNQVGGLPLALSTDAEQTYVELAEAFWDIDFGKLKI